MTERGLTLAVLATTFVLGVLTFPHALEPGLSERNGPNTDLVVDGRLNVGTWLPDSQGGRIDPVAADIRLHTTGSRTILISRTLAIFPRTCYRLAVSGSARGNGLRVVVKDERARHVIAAAALPQSSETRLSSRFFDSGEHERVTLTVESNRATVADIRSISLRKMPAACDSE